MHAQEAGYKQADLVRAFAGTFRLTIEFSEEYPNKAPVVKFKSNMFHPNSACLRLVIACWSFPFVCICIGALLPRGGDTATSDCNLTTCL